MRIEDILTRSVKQHLFPGAVFGICTPTSLQIIPAGSHTYDPDAASVTADTRYDVASLTKTVPTAYLIWKFIERGKLSLEQPIQHFLPEWQGQYKDQVLLWHLLAHAVKYESVSLSSISSDGYQALTQKIWEMKLVEPPGHSYYYVNTNSILLGWILERVEGKNLQTLAQEYFWKPLGMTSTSFFPSASEMSKIVPTELQADGTLLQGKVHDESASVLSKEGRAAGSAGLFSSVPDLLRFLQMLLRGGEQVFLPSTVAASWQTRPLITGQPVGLGWEYNHSTWMGNLNTDCFGKTGFTGGFCAVFPKEQRGIVMLSNVVYPHRPPERSKLAELRQNLLAISLECDL